MQTVRRVSVVLAVVCLLGAGPTWGDTSAGCGAGGYVPPNGTIYHPGDWISASAGASGVADSNYWGPGGGTLSGYAYGRNTCSLWATVEGEFEFAITMQASATGAGMVSWQCEGFAQAMAMAGKTAAWEDIGQHWAAVVGHGDAYAEDPEETQDPPEAIWAAASQFEVRGWGPPPGGGGGMGAPPAGGEGTGLGDVISPGEKS